MTGFSTFHSTGAVLPASIERFGRSVPEPVLELWRTSGTGLIGEDGFVRVIDPAWYADHLATWFDNAEGAGTAARIGDRSVTQPGWLVRS